MINKLVKWWFNHRYRTNPPEMVKYWQWNKDAALAKVGKTEDGSYQMEIRGEKYMYPGFPRGYLLQGSLSKLKHFIKNQFFNEAWAKLEAKVSESSIIKKLKGEVLNKVVEIVEANKYDIPPVERMVAPVKEIWKGWTAVETAYSQHRKKLNNLKKCLCLILHEDDAYRFRVQWLFRYFKGDLKSFEDGLIKMENAEVVGDMKDRIRLLRRILLLILKDKQIKDMFDLFCKNLNWKKILLSKADEYYFRGKYFKVDHSRYDY